MACNPSSKSSTLIQLFDPSMGLPAKSQVLSATANQTVQYLPDAGPFPFRPEASPKKLISWDVIRSQRVADPLRVYLEDGMSYE